MKGINPLLAFVLGEIQEELRVTSPSGSQPITRLVPESDILTLGRAAAMQVTRYVEHSG